MAQQHRQAQYAYAAAVRQADALSRHQVELAKQAALQGRAEARRGQREAAQAQVEAEKRKQRQTRRKRKQNARTTRHH